MKKVINRFNKQQCQGDYYNKLSVEELSWIQAFDQAYDWGNPKKLLAKTDLSDDFKQECYRRNNHRDAMDIISGCGFDVYAEVRLKKTND